MAIPTAIFNFKATGLSVVFEDLSANTPTSWAWDFGDATPASNAQNPTHAFAASGTYKVKLTATNGDGSNSFEVKIVVSSVPGVNLTIRDWVKMDVPNGLVLSEILISQEIQKWQLYLQPMVEIPFEVLESDTFDESKWPSLTNVLIAKLVIWDQIISQSRQAMLSGSSQTSTTSQTSAGGLKRVESGPSVVEWYNGSEFWSTMFKGQDGKGFMGTITQEICLLASRQGIYLPEICPTTLRTKLFIVGKKPC